MLALSYVLACLLILAIYSSLCWSLHYLPVGLYDDVAHYVRIALVTEVVLSCFQFFAWARDTFAFVPKMKLSFPELAPTSVASKFGVPLMEELTRFATLAMLVFLGNTDYNCNVTYVYTVAAVYGFNHLVGSMVKFCPFNYHRRFHKFLAGYDIYKAHLLKSVKKALSTMSFALDSDTLASLPAKPVFNLNSFEKEPLLSHSKLIRSIRLDTLDANPEILDRMYSVSPKNTLHLQLDKSGSEDEVSSKVLAKFKSLENFWEQGADTPSELNSLHSSDTHFGGGGGGNFKMKLPNGTELEFGGGAGLDYKHHSSCESESSSDTSGASNTRYSPPQWTKSKTSSNLSLMNSPYALGPSAHSPSALSPSVLSPYATSTSSRSNSSVLESIIFWFRWLLPVTKKEDDTHISPLALRQTIRKKMSTFTLNSDTASLKSVPCKLYGSIDLESQLPEKSARFTAENVHGYYEFAKFANQYFDVRTPRLLEFYKGVDPAFYHFGTLLPNFPAFFYIVYSTSICLWQYSSTLILAYPFVAADPRLVTFMGIICILAVLKLFCINYLHNQATCSYRVSLVVELVLNLGFFASVYSRYFTL